MIKPKSANQLYKASGSTLPFNEWIDREKQKYHNAIGSGLDIPMIGNKPLTDSINRTLEKMRNEGPVQTKVSGKTVLGINKYAIYGAAGIIAIAIIYKVIKANKERK